MTALPTGPVGNWASRAGRKEPLLWDAGYRMRPSAPCVPSRQVPLVCGDSSSCCPCRHSWAWGKSPWMHPLLRQVLQCHMQVPALRKGSSGASRSNACQGDGGLAGPPGTPLLLPPLPFPTHPPVGQAGTFLAGNRQHL